MQHFLSASGPLFLSRKLRCVNFENVTFIKGISGPDLWELKGSKRALSTRPGSDRNKSAKSRYIPGIGTGYKGVKK